MATLKRRTVLALTAGVWAMAIGSASALAYALNRPLEVRTTGMEFAPVTELAPATQFEAPATEVAPAMEYTPIPMTTLSIPTITIVSKAPHRRPPANVSSQPAEEKSIESLPDISKMNCAEWRELDMGSGRVQVCE